MRFTLITLAFVLSALVATTLAAPKFVEPLRVPLGGVGHFSVVVADFNRDGKPDMAATEYPGSAVDIALGTGTGFSAPASFATGSYPAGLAVADFNHDGKLDLVTANDDSTSAVSILLGKGDGTFRPQISYSLDSGAASVVVADFNGDGNPDIGLGAGSVMVLLGNGDGTFRLGRTLADAGPALAAGDLNGDGKIDLVAGGKDNAKGFLGNGDGTFASPIDYHIGGVTWGIALADVNNDGKLDIAATHLSRGAVSVLLGNGDGTFKTRMDYSTGNDPWLIVVSDIDGDGRPDLVIGNGSSVGIRFGKGDGTFGSLALYGTTLSASGSPAGLTIADVNGDGKGDVLTASFVQPFVSVLVNYGGGKLRARPNINIGHYPVGPDVGDFNNDGIDDVITASYLGGHIVSVALGSRTGSRKRRTTSIDFSPGKILAGDFDGDGRLDALLQDFSLFTYQVLLGNGDGTFHPPTSQALPESGTVATADLNHDGKLDLVSLGNQTIYILLGNGNGTFGQPTSIAVGQQLFGSIAIDDFNRDGKLDMAVGAASRSSILLFLGKGDGTFQSPVNSTANFVGGVRSGDFNGDGVPDLAGVAAVATGGFSDSGVGILFSNGDGTFQPEVEYAFPYTDNLAIGDFNSDGKLDLALARSFESVVTLLLNNGDGVFAQEGDYAFGGDYVFGDVGMATGDFNHDGSPDIAIVEFASYASVIDLLLNTGVQ